MQSLRDVVSAKSLPCRPNPNALATPPSPGRPVWLAFPSHAAVRQRKTGADGLTFHPKSWTACVACENSASRGTIHLLKQRDGRHGSESVSFLHKAGSAKETKAQSPGVGTMGVATSWGASAFVPVPARAAWPHLLFWVLFDTLLSGQATREWPGPSKVWFPAAFEITVHPAHILRRSVG